MPPGSGSIGHVCTFATGFPLRISTRLLLLLTLAVGAVLGIYAYLELEREALDLRATAERDLSRLGVAAQTAVEAARDDPAATDALLRRLDAREDDVQIELLESDGRPRLGPSVPSLDQETARRLVADVAARQHPITLFEESETEAPRLLYAAPLFEPHTATAPTLVLMRRLGDFESDLAHERRDTVAFTLLLAGVIGTIAWLMFHFHVQHPLNRLVQAMRLVRAGQLGTHVDVTRDDEVGEVMAEFNTLSANLVRTQQALTDEMEARRHLEGSLQHVDKLVAIGQLSAGIAHEIGSPLQIVGGRARMLAQRADLPADARRNATIVVEQTDRITHIVEQLLHFARRRNRQIGRVDSLRLGRTVFEMLHPEAKRRGIVLTLGADDRLPPVTADADQLQQVLLNLLMNALKATRPDGQIRLTLRAGPPPASAPGAAAGLVIEIADTGCGMDEDVRRQIFEPFFTRWSADMPAGTGLGLSIVQTIVREHHGEIEVASAPGQGTRFTVRLPADALPATEAPPPATESAPHVHV